VTTASGTEDSVKIPDHVTNAWIGILCATEFIWITHIDLPEPMKTLMELEAAGAALDEALVGMVMAALTEVI
jgi:hypothetical protein